MIDPKRMIYIKPDDPNFSVVGLLASYELDLEVRPYGRILIGRFSAGLLANIKFYNGVEGDYALTIGSFCESTLDVKIVVGGVHRSENIWDVCLGPMSGYFKPHQSKVAKQICSPKPANPIHIGRNTVLHTNSVVVGGTNIGRGSIVAAGAVVRGDHPPYSIIGGVPAKQISPRFSSKEFADLSDDLDMSLVRADCIPTVPEFVHAVQCGQLKLSDKHQRLRFLPAAPRLHMLADSTPDGLTLQQPHGFSIGGAQVSNVGALALMKLYFEQFWTRPDRLMWCPDVFFLLDLYGHGDRL